MTTTYKLSKNNTAEIQNSTLFLKIGLFNYEIPINTITGIYRYKQTEDYDLLAISYRAENKTKKQQIPLSKMIPQPFVDEIFAQAPNSANLMRMEKAEALRAIGVMDGKKLGYLGLAVILPLILAGMFFPQIYHLVFDSTPAQTTVEELYTGTGPGSNYLAFTGTLKKEGLVVSYKPWGRIFSKNTSWQKKGFFPIVPNNWQEGDPIKIIAMIDGAYYLDQTKHLLDRQIKIKGMVRNVLWEKLLWSGWIDDFSRKVQSPVENPKVIELETDKTTEIWFSWLAALVLIPLAIVIKLWMNYRAKK